ncbi:nucleic acid-binding protein [Venturia nashicola]|nr:nucleic acid-binding protein [Venturia nashicola]
MSLAQQIQPKVGVVISAGKMMKTVKVRVAKQKWNKRIQKFYDEPFNILVSDPTQSVREGDVISCISGLRSSSTVRHVVTGIIAPMGPPLSERPPVPTESQRLAAREADRAARDIKQAAKGRVVAGRRAAERRRLEEIARQERRAEQALYKAQKLKREQAEMKQRKKAAKLLVRYEMLNQDTLQSFAHRLSISLENQISAQEVSLAHHMQEAQTSLEQGRRFQGSFQKELNRLEGELGVVLEKPLEQIRLEAVIRAIQLMIKEAQLKITRLEKYLDRIRGQEHQLRDADAMLLKKAQGVTQPEDFAWVNIIKELEMTENEKKAARLDLHKPVPTTATIVTKQKAVQREKEAARTKSSKDGSTTGTKPPPDSQTPKPNVVKEAVEEPKTEEPKTEEPKTEEPKTEEPKTEEPKKKKWGGIFGWFGR